MDRYEKKEWTVERAGSKVVIEPPRSIDRKFDDMWLQVTGNFDLEEGAKFVCDLLNKAMPEQSQEQG